MWADNGARFLTFWLKRLGLLKCSPYKKQSECQWLSDKAVPFAVANNVVNFFAFSKSKTIYIGFRIYPILSQHHQNEYTDACCLLLSRTFLNVKKDTFSTLHIHFWKCVEPVTCKQSNSLEKLHRDILSNICMDTTQ